MAFMIVVSLVTVETFGAYENFSAPTGPVDLTWTANLGELHLNPVIMQKLVIQLQGDIILKQVPGAVFTVGRRGGALKPRAYGDAQITPEKRPMHPDTQFDLAGLTGMISTIPCVLKLIEEGKLNIDAPVSKYIPAFAKNGKGSITIRHVLYSQSGLPVWKPFYKTCKNKQVVFDAINSLKPVWAPGTRTSYSDCDGILLQELVEKVSGQSLDVFAQKQIFEPLGMKNTHYNPDRKDLTRFAATELSPYHKRIMIGEVHDENAWAMGKVAGHAGLFSNAHDLAIFAQMLLNGGTYGGKQILKPESVRMIFTPKSPGAYSCSFMLGKGSGKTLVGLGPGSFGRNGFTGCSLWIKPREYLFVVLLTNAVHPGRKTHKVSEFRRTVHSLLLQAAGIK